MEQRVEAAAHSGEVTLLRQLLQEDALLLRRQASDDDTPLHIAASHGHLLFLQEVLAVNPDLAFARNPQGQTALHLAAAQGHLNVVKELLLRCKDTEQLCSAQDKDGFMPVHTAAVHGRIDVLNELLHTCLESANSRTAEGDSIFHLAAKSNSIETVQFLLDWTEVVPSQLLESTDEKGNTTLHVAVARKQLCTVKLLLGREGVRVNARNKRGCTALDVLIESPAQHGDLVLRGQIRAAGGKTSAELQGGQAPVSLLQKDVESSSLTGSRPSRWRRWRRYWRINKEDHGIDGTEKYNNKPGTMMVVATLIATITFQAGLNPPGGFTQKNDSSPSPGASIEETDFYCGYVCRRNIEGQAVLGDRLSWFLAFDMMGLFLSLSIILLLICCAPRKKKMVLGFLKWILWLSVFFTALAFSVAVKEIFVSNPYTRLFLLCWFMLLSIFMVWLCFRVMRFLLRKGGCWKDKQSQTGPTKAPFGNTGRAASPLTRAEERKEMRTLTCALTGAPPDPQVKAHSQRLSHRDDIDCCYHHKGPTKTVAIITKTVVGILLIILLGGFLLLGLNLLNIVR